MNTHGEWMLFDEAGQSALSFTSFIDISFSSDGQVLSYPVEAGGFVNYNKTQNPVTIRITLNTQGTPADFEYIELKLKEYQNEAVKLAVSTPSALYDNLTLKSHSIDRSREHAGILPVVLTLVEVREVDNNPASKVYNNGKKNPTSNGKKGTGKTQPHENAILDNISRP